MNGQWLTILEYAHETGKSISTLRRYLKAKKLESKLVDGKYLIWKENKSNEEFVKENQSDLEKVLRAKEEEICELKMLVSLYESKIKKSDEPPAIPLG